MERYLEALSAISTLAWLVSALAIIVIGNIWYSPFLFGRSWQRHSGIRASDIQPSEARKSYIFAFFSALILSYLLGIVANHATSIHAVLFSVLFVWVFIMLEQFNSFIWEREAFALFLIHAARSLVSLSAASAIHFIL